MAESSKGKHAASSMSVHRTGQSKTRSKETARYLRKESVPKANKRHIQAPRQRYPPIMQAILGRADTMSLTPYILQLPGSAFNTGSMLQSPAEKEYKKAIKLAQERSDTSSISSIAMKVSERMEEAGRLDNAFKWASMSGDRAAFKIAGARIAKTYERQARDKPNGFLSNEYNLGRYRKAVEFAAISGNMGMAEKLGSIGARKFEAYGDLCAQQPFRAVLGLEFGYARAIRWARASGNDVLAERIKNKVMDLYENVPSVNAMSLIAVAVIGDSEQKNLIRDILERRKSNAVELATATER